MTIHEVTTVAEAAHAHAVGADMLVPHRLRGSLWQRSPLLLAAGAALRWRQTTNDAPATRRHRAYRAPRAETYSDTREVQTMALATLFETWRARGLNAFHECLSVLHFPLPQV